MRATVTDFQMTIEPVTATTEDVYAAHVADTLGQDTDDVQITAVQHDYELDVTYIDGVIHHG